MNGPSESDENPAGLSERMASAVAQHIAERGVLLDPQAAIDQCQSESAAFMETLAAFEVEATVVSGLLVRGDLVMAGHFAVRVGDEVWDWTARQFDPAADVPLVTLWDVWRTKWKDATEGWTDPLGLICDCEYHRSLSDA